MTLGIYSKGIDKIHIEIFDQVNLLRGFLFRHIRLIDMNYLA